jgi:hypothetical protein
MSAATDDDVDRIAAAILATRARGLGRHQWARRAAAAVIELMEEGEIHPPALRTILIRETATGMVFVTSEDEPPIFIAGRDLSTTVGWLAAVLWGEA